MKVKILYEDKDLWVVHKPAGLATQTGAVAQADVVSELKSYQKRQGGSSYVGVVHRLDQPVEGLLVFAKNPKAASVLSGQLQKGTLHKYYYVAVYGEPVTEEGELEDYLYKDEKNRAVVVTGKENLYQEAKIAKLKYRVLKICQESVKKGNTQETYSLLEIELTTGRFHQIRAQMAHAGLPLLGDLKYGSEQSAALSRKMQVGNVALCAYKLNLIHPADRKQMNFAIEPEAEIFRGIANK